jgi:hypothetical protein
MKASEIRNQAMPIRKRPLYLILALLLSVPAVAATTGTAHAALITYCNRDIAQGKECASASYLSLTGGTVGRQWRPSPGGAGSGGLGVVGGDAAALVGAEVLDQAEEFGVVGEPVAVHLGDLVADLGVGVVGEVQ